MRTGRGARRQGEPRLSALRRLLRGVFDRRAAAGECLRYGSRRQSGPHNRVRQVWIPLGVRGLSARSERPVGLKRILADGENSAAATAEKRSDLRFVGDESLANLMAMHLGGEYQ